MKPLQITTLQMAMMHYIIMQHKRGVSMYTMDKEPDLWTIAYYPIFQDGKTQEYYKEPRALMQNLNKPGFWYKEVPLRYLTLKD